MAYTLRYYKTLPQPGDRDIVLEIYEKDGVRSSMEIGPVIQALHLDIQGSQEDIDTPVVKTSLVMTFVDAQDHEEASSKKCGNWEEFYTSDSTYWKVLLFVKDSDVQEARQIWGGYVTPDSFTEQLRYRGSVTIVARDNIGHMQDCPFDSKGNEDGMITVYDLVNTAWAKIESPMSLNWRGEEDEAMWLQCDGHDVTGAYLNVSAFKGMNWYEAMEKVLYSIGAVMRYVGDNTVQVSSLRYMPYQGSASMSSLAEIEPKFIAHANRELVPAVRRIEESVKYDISEVLLPLVEPSDFRGDVINGNVWPLINTESGNGWCNVMPSTALYFNPNGYAIEEYPYRPAFEMAQEQIYDSMFLLCNTEGLAEYSQVFAPREVTLEVGLGGNIWLKDGKIINTASTVIRVRYAIKVVYNGIDYFLDEDGSWTESYVEYTATRDGESSLRIKSISHSIPLQAFDAPVVLHFYILELFDLNAEGKNIYVQVQSLKVIPNDNDSLLQTNNVNTIYNNDNNVIISRDPTIGPAYDFVYYGIIKNGMFIKSGDVYLPAKAWAWSGGTPQQMAVYNHLQLLCYHAKPNNVITGDIVNADLGNLRALYMWHGSEHLLQGGSLNFLNGRIEGAILREFARYDDMWGDVTGDSMPATEQESSTNVEEGGSSSGSSATYENTTNVTIGGSGGGSVTVDTFLSDTSTNPVQNRAIKVYVDSVDNQLEEKIGNLAERIDSLENGTSGGAGAVIFDATSSTDPWNLNELQTTTTYEAIKAAIEGNTPIYMRFAEAFVAVASAEIYSSGDVSLYVHLVDPESEIIRTVHTYAGSDGVWYWESFNGNYATKTYVDGKATTLQTNINTKAGAFYVEESTGLFIAFTTEEAKAAYISSGDESGVIGKFALAGSGGGGETVYSMQVTNLQSSYSYTTASEKMEITANFVSKVKYAGNDSYESFNESAIFSVEVYKAGGTSSSVVANGIIVQDGGTFKIDLKPYMGNGDNTVIIRAVGLVSSALGIASTTVAVTSMSLSPFNFNWHLPFIEGQSYKLGGLRILGALDKTLHIKVTGSGYSKEYTVAIGTTQYDKTAYNYTSLEHPSATGVYKVEMWLEATASGLLSETLTYNIMCVASEDVSSAQLICINNVASEVQNYAESTIFDYAIYNAGATSGSPTITLKMGSTTIASTTLSSVTTASQNTYKYSFSVANAGSSATITATATYGNTQTATMTLNNETSFAPVDGYSFYLNAATRSNAESNKRYIVNEVDGSQISASWTDMAWVDGMDGWTTDENGYKCLLLPAMSKAVVNMTPMKDKTTVTIEMLYKVKNASDYTEDIITMATDTTSSWMGVKIKPTNITLHSQSLFADDLVQGYNLKDEELVHLVVMIEQNYAGIGNIAMVYVNGVKKCAFEWSTGDTFAHSGVLKLGSDTADLYLYSMRVYDRGFEWESAMQNYISALQEITERVAVNVKEESVLTDANDLDYDKIYGKYNTFVVELPKGAVLPDKLSNPSNDAIGGSNLYINIVQDTSCSIQGDWLDVPLEGQGTTAMTYYRWNLRSKTSSAYDKFRITAKKNVASSMHSHKRGATALYNDLNLAIVGANEANGRVAVYQYPAYGFQKIENEDAPGTYYYEFIGLYTIGPDKGDKSTFGYDNEAYEDTLIHMEGTDHSPKGVGMDYPWEQMTVGLNDDGDAFIGRKNAAGGLGEEAWEIGACGSYEDASAMKTYLDTEFAPAYRLDYECTPLIVGLESGTTIADVNADVAAFRATMRTDGFSYGDCLVYDNDYNTYYFNAVSGQYVADGSKIYDGLSAYGFSTSTLAGYSSVSAKTDYIVSCRKARYRAEMGNYWHKNDNLFHACFLDLIGATDNEKKNSYPYKFGTLASGSRWRWRQDDLDTIFDVNNQGSADKKYSIMNTDLQGTTMIYKGNTSYHWRCVREYFPTEMKEMMQTIMNKMVSLCPSGYGSSKIQKLVGCIRHYFWDYAQDYFTRGAYNIDAEWTYEDTWALYKTNSNVNAVHPLRQLLGSHYEAEVAWVTLRMLFLASMNEFGAFVDYVDTSEGQISFRQGGDFTFKLTPAIDMRPSVVIGANSDKKFASGRILAGNSTSISVAADTSADTMVYVQGADWLQDIGDFSKVKIGSSSGIFSVTSKRLQSLKVGDATASNVTTNMTGLEFGACPSMEEVEARNVAGLAGEIDLTKCPRLRRAYFGGTSVTAILLPNGSKIQEYVLPSTMQRLTLRQLPLLQKSGLTYDSLNALTYLWVEGNKGLDGYDLLKTAFDGGSPLNNIRVVGFTKDGDATDVAFLATLANGNYHGIDDSGNADNLILPYLEGTVNVNGNIYQDDAEAITAAYENRVFINALGYYLQFADAEVLRVLLENITTDDGIGITVEDAEAVTSIERWFKGNTEITSFDEFENFTGVTSLVSGSSSTLGAFTGCTNLESIKLPSSLTVFGNYSFQGCSKLSITEIPVGTTSIGSSAFYGVAQCPQNVILPNLTFLGVAAFKASAGIKKVLNLGKITEIVGGGSIATNSSPFYGCIDVEVFIIPSTVTTLGKGAISYMPSLHTLISKATTPPTFTDNSLYSLGALTGIYVPDASVEAYKGASGWSSATWQAKIKPISQLATDNPTLYAEIEEYL